MIEYNKINCGSQPYAMPCGRQERHLTGVCLNEGLLSTEHGISKPTLINIYIYPYFRSSLSLCTCISTSSKHHIMHTYV